MFQSVRFSSAQTLVITLLSCVLVSACASRSESRTAEQVLPEQQTTTGVQFGPDCTDPRDRALPQDSSPAHDPMFTQCDPDYYVVQGQRRAVGPGPVLERGSINLPETPVPLPDGLGVFRR